MKVLTSRILAMDTLDKKFIDFLGAILQAKKVLLVTHYKPDGDALSSICVR